MQPLELSIYETLEQAREAASGHRQALPEREFRVVRRLVREEVVDETVEDDGRSEDVDKGRQ